LQDLCREFSDLMRAVTVAQCGGISRHALDRLLDSVPAILLLHGTDSSDCVSAISLVSCGQAKAY
jgi:hypothetical protein